MDDSISAKDPGMVDLVAPEPLLGLGVIMLCFDMFLLSGYLT